MRHTRLDRMQCPIARSLHHVGEWWSILILRDAFQGFTRFDDFQQDLQIAPNILTRRLKRLVDARLLERRLYCEHPPRFEYVLTQRGWDFQPVVVALYDWGSKHFAPEGASVLLVHAKTGRRAEPILTDGRTGRRLDPHRYAFIAGPAADAHTRRRLARKARARATRSA